MTMAQSPAQTLARYAPQITVFVAVVIAWEVIVRALNIPRFLLPAPSVIVAALIATFGTVIESAWYAAQRTAGLLDRLRRRDRGGVGNGALGDRARRAIARRHCRELHSHHRLRADHQQLVRQQ